MQIIAEFMEKVQWYRPTTDADDWATFLGAIQLGSQPPASTVGQVVQMAQAVAQMQPGEDVGMWQGLMISFGWFVKQYGSQPPASPLTDPCQYDYVQCFVNEYWNAAHNKDLWQSMNDAAQSIHPGQPG